MRTTRAASPGGHADVRGDAPGTDGDPGAGLSVLHVVVRATATNSQYNEHCLPVRHSRRITVCSLFPAEVDVPADIRLVQGSGSIPGVFAALRRALRAGSYDVVHVHAAASAMVTLAVYLGLGRPLRDLVFTVHNSWTSFRPRNRAFLHLVAAAFPVLVVCGEAAAATLPRRIRRLAGRVEVIPNGVDLDRVDRSTAGEPVDRSGVVSVSRLIPVKRPDVVMAAYLRVARPDDGLVLVGTGPLADALVRTARHACPEAGVRFTGLVPRDEVYPLLAGARVFVSASLGEGLPVSVLEAMACRCPVLLSDIGPHREIARRSTAVRLVPPGDVEGFAAALADLLAEGPDERTRRGEELRACVEEHFSVTTMNHRYGGLYRELAATRGAAR